LNLQSALVETEKDEIVLEKELREKMSGNVPEAQIGRQMKQLTLPWMRSFLTYDPAIALRHVTCPVLAIQWLARQTSSARPKSACHSHSACPKQTRRS